MKGLSVYLFFFACQFSLASCSSNLLKTYLETDKEAGFFEISQKNVSNNSRSLSSNNKILNQIFNTADIQKEVAILNTYQAEINSVEAKKNVNFLITSSAGIKSEQYNSSDPSVLGTIKASKVLSDNQQIDYAIKIAEINYKIQLIKLHKKINKKIHELSQNALAFESSNNKIKIIDDYLDIFLSKVDLIENAVNAGAVSSTVYLGLKSNKNLMLLEKSRSMKNVELAKVKLNKFDRVILSHKSVSDFPPEKLFQYLSKENNLDFKIASFNLEKNRLEQLKKNSAKKPTTSLEASISTPQTKDKDHNIFAGISMNFPVNDGGLINSELLVLTEKQNALNQQKEVLAEKIDRWAKELRIIYDYTKNEKKLLQEKIEIQRLRVEQLDALNNSGIQDPVKLAEEIFVLSNALLDAIDTDAKYASSVLENLYKAHSSCLITKSCEDLKNSISQFQK